MGKIMSFGYAKDWKEQHDQWDKTQARRVTKTDAPVPPVAAEGTEYQDVFLQKTDPSRVAKAGRRAGQTPTDERT